jgi:hypothetical protein
MCKNVYVYKEKSRVKSLLAGPLVEFNIGKASCRKLEDSEAAEKYCAEIGRPGAYLE